MIVNEFCDVPSCPGVAVSPDGRVRGRSGKVIKPRVSGHGSRWIYYPYSSSPDRVPVWVADLVCEAFHGPRPTPAHRVRHAKGDNGDDRADSLSWYLPRGGRS